MLLVPTKGVLPCFLDYLKQLNRKFGKILVYADRAPQHKSKLIQKYLDENSDNIMLHWFPKGSPQFNAVEEVWKQGKYNLLVSQYQPSLSNLKSNIYKYYRTRDSNSLSPKEIIPFENSSFDNCFVVLSPFVEYHKRLICNCLNSQNHIKCNYGQLSD